MTLVSIILSVGLHNMCTFIALEMNAIITVMDCTEKDAEIQEKNVIY